MDGKVEETQGGGLEVSLEPYVGLTVHDSAYLIALDGKTTGDPGLPTQAISYSKLTGAEQLRFIPYALRCNRGGQGHMRVGIRRAR